MLHKCKKTEKVPKLRRLQSEAAPRGQMLVAVCDIVAALAALMFSKTKRLGRAHIMRSRSDRDAAIRKCREAELLRSLSRQFHPPAYVSRSTLEALVLQQSRLRMWGIKAVMIDYAVSGSSEGINWRIAGFISGTADRDAATVAITSAAHKYAMWIMVDDANPLVGEMVKLRPAVGGLS